MKPKGRASDALWFGELVHIALANWYSGPGLKRGPHPAETFTTLATDELRMMKTDDATEEEVAKYVDMRTMGTVLLETYVQHYGIDPRWSVIAPEQTFSFKIPFPEWWGEASRAILCDYVGTADLVYRDLDAGTLWLGEHKTAKAVQTKHLPLDEQAGSYWAVMTTSLRKAGLITAKESLRGIMYNFIRKGVPDPRPVDAQGYCLNKDGSRSKVQPKPLLVRHPVVRIRHEQRSQLNRIQKDAAIMEMVRTGELPVTKTTHTSCSRCDFYEMCMLHEQGGDWQAYKEVAYRVQDPYADHRKTAEEPGTFEIG